MRGLLRMTRLARRPMSVGRVKLIFGVVLACLALYGIEVIWGWPEGLTINGNARMMKP